SQPRSREQREETGWSDSGASGRRRPRPCNTCSICRFPTKRTPIVTTVCWLWHARMAQYNSLHSGTALAAAERAGRAVSCSVPKKHPEENRILSIRRRFSPKIDMRARSSSTEPSEPYVALEQGSAQALAALIAVFQR